ncbi:hypothetical protein [Maritalea sp.]|jgi:hypothetical protein|uniref:hypothetical protein n=1 Tax=Maritalea sp. TaxID=2003361 RepID=UPI0039E55C71
MIVFDKLSTAIGWIFKALLWAIGSLVAIIVLVVGGFYIYWNYIVYEMPDYTQSEINEIVLEVLEKHNIPLTRNLRAIWLPTMRLDPYGPYLRTVGGGRSILSGRTIEECGEPCQKLLVEGFVDEIIPMSNYSIPTGGNTTAFDDEAFSQDQERLFGNDLRSIHNREWMEKRKRRTTLDFDQDWYESEIYYCFVEPLPKEQTLKVCTELGNFTFAVANGRWNDASFGEKLYGNVAEVGQYTIEGYTTWYQLIEYLELRQLR